jgi:ribosomal protein S18 acetylase RimI-like enzyme
MTGGGTAGHGADGVLIREATTADIDGLAASNAALFAADAAARDPLRNPDWAGSHAAEHVAGTLADPAVLVLAAEARRDIVGHLTGVLLPASVMWTVPRAELFSMHVMAPWRDQGIGSRLVDRFRDWAESRGAAQLRVSAYTANEGALRFYRRHGFCPLDTTLTLDI